MAEDPAGRDVPPTMPSRRAFLVSFVSVVVAGLFGGVIGYGLVDISCTRSCSGESAIGAVAGAVDGAVGVGIVAVLVLRAMSEWRHSDRSGRTNGDK